MGQDRKRQPAGITAGGQFATQRRDEAAVGLDPVIDPDLEADIDTALDAAVDEIEAASYSVVDFDDSDDGVLPSDVQEAVDYIREAISDEGYRSMPTTIVAFGESPSRPAGFSVEMSIEDTVSCDGCEQTVTRKGPVAWVDERTGEDIGSHDKQHGCGTWNTPVSRRITIPAETPMDEVRASVAKLAKSVSDDHDRDMERAAEAISERVTDKLKEAIALRDSGEDPELYLSGNDTHPGVWINENGEIEAWAFAPSDGDRHETITVTESDLQNA